MWIRIRADGAPNISIPVPLFMLGSPRIINMAARYGVSDIAKYAPIARQMVREFRRYVRENGHFTLVDVESEGATVKIIV